MNKPIRCPHCGKVFFDNENKYCPFCKKLLNDVFGLFNDMFGNIFGDK
jgi:phage FluMu protein Com